MGELAIGSIGGDKQSKYVDDDPGKKVGDKVQKDGLASNGETWNKLKSENTFLEAAGIASVCGAKIVSAAPGVVGLAVELHEVSTGTAEDLRKGDVAKALYRVGEFGLLKVAEHSLPVLQIPIAAATGAAGVGECYAHIKEKTAEAVGHTVQVLHNERVEIMIAKHYLDSGMISGKQYSDFASMRSPSAQAFSAAMLADPAHAKLQTEFDVAAKESGALPKMDAAFRKGEVSAYEKDIKTPFDLLDRCTKDPQFADAYRSSVEFKLGVDRAIDLARSDSKKWESEKAKNVIPKSELKVKG